MDTDIAESFEEKRDLQSEAKIELSSKTAEEKIELSSETAETVNELSSLPVVKEEDEKKPAIKFYKIPVKGDGSCLCKLSWHSFSAFKLQLTYSFNTLTQSPPYEFQWKLFMWSRKFWKTIHQHPLYLMVTMKLWLEQP